MKTLIELIRDTKWEQSAEELAIGYLRYMAVRKLTPRQFKDIHIRNTMGENFDTMINELILQSATEK